jgi:hypothetical protein
MELSQGYLSAIFGWIPLVHDLEQIIDRLTYIRFELDAFIEGSDKRQTRHYQKALHPETFRDASWFDTVDGPNVTVDHTDFGSPSGTGFVDDLFEFTMQPHRTRSVSDLKFRATMDFTYHIPDLGKFTKILGAMDKLGINPDLSDLWEVIPFSFVVDWIFDIGSFLEEKAQADNLPIELVIHDYCYSYKYKFSDTRTYSYVSKAETFDMDQFVTQALGPFEFYDQWALGPSEWGLYTTPTGAERVITLSAYHRWRYAPLVEIGDAFPQFTLPSGKQIVTGAALIGALS